MFSGCAVFLATLFVVIGGFQNESDTNNGYLQNQIDSFTSTEEVTDVTDDQNYTSYDHDDEDETPTTDDNFGSPEGVTLKFWSTLVEQQRPHISPRYVFILVVRGSSHSTGYSITPRWVVTSNHMFAGVNGSFPDDVWAFNSDKLLPIVRVVRFEQIEAGLENNYALCKTQIPGFYMIYWRRVASTAKWPAKFIHREAFFTHIRRSGNDFYQRTYEATLRHPSKCTSEPSVTFDNLWICLEYNETDDCVPGPRQGIATVGRFQNILVGISMEHDADCLLQEQHLPILYVPYYLSTILEIVSFVNEVNLDFTITQATLDRAVVLEPWSLLVLTIILHLVIIRVL